MNSLSKDDIVLVLKLSMPFVAGPAAASLTSTCKDMKECRYTSFLKKEKFKCVACERVIGLSHLHSRCKYHPGTSKVWVMNWEDSCEGMMYSGYSMHTCCKTQGGQECKEAASHNNTGRRCKTCGNIIEPRDFKAPCQHHPSRGATYTKPEWECCKSGDFGAVGCKTVGHHTFDNEPIYNVVWSKLGTKALVRTETAMYVLGYHAREEGEKGEKGEREERQERGVWTEEWSMEDYIDSGASSLKQDHQSGLDSSFSHDGMKIMIRAGNVHYLFDIKSGTPTKINESGHHDDDRYLFFLSNSPDSDYGEILLNAYDLKNKKLIQFANFTTSIPFDYDRPKSLGKAILVQASYGEKRSFKHPDLKSFISNWTHRDALRVMEPYGNRMLFVGAHKSAVHYSYKVVGGKIQIDVLGSVEHIWSGIRNSLHGIHWLKNGFIALVQENRQGYAFYKRYKYQVWWFNDKLEKIKSIKLPKELREKQKENPVTLFKYDEDAKQFFYASKAKFFVLNENLEILFSISWGGFDSYNASTWFHPRSRISIYSGTVQGITAHIPRLGLNIGEVEDGHFFDSKFFSHNCRTRGSLLTFK